MKKCFAATLALCMYNISVANAAPAPAGFTVLAECKNLALMQAELLNTQFHTNVVASSTYNPPSLTLKTNSGYGIGKVEYLGGDSEDQSGPNAGNYPCDKNPNLCNHLPDAGGAFDWARLTVTSEGTPTAQVVVSMGGRGGCIINSAKYVQPR